MLSFVWWESYTNKLARNTLPGQKEEVQLKQSSDFRRRSKAADIRPNNMIVLGSGTSTTRMSC